MLSTVFLLNLVHAYFCSCPPEAKEKSNGYGALLEGDEVDATTEDWLHSSDEDNEEEGRTDGTRPESSSLDCSGSRPLLQDFDEDEDQEAGTSENLPMSSDSPPSAVQESSMITQPSQGVTRNHLPPASNPDPDIFSIAPFRATQEAVSDVDVFANAPFPRPSTQPQQADIFLQAPFGMRKKTEGMVYAHPVQQPGLQPAQKVPSYHGSHEQSVLDQVAPLPFRPQALAKYSRHYEGPDVTTDDPFVAAPFRLKGPQEKH
ncbi:uncharacterized protein FLJ45252-like [Trichomycterus rosablanca]|uniref:uncharacterized protein FLJ45252-like n=1 Tax=Trichomycterus rosablanca TaxID=2290929 RepID=UPI002F357F75